MPPDEPAATTDQAVSVPGETDPLSSNLKHASTFYIAQRIELCEIFTGCEMLNKYDFYNEHNELFLKATEDSDFCTRQCCGQNRPLDILFTDASQTREIMRMERPCSCLTDRLSVCYPVGRRVGEVQVATCCRCRLRYRIRDAGGEEVLYCVSPCVCVMSMQSLCCRDIHIRVEDANKNEIGFITKKWSGVLREVLTDTDRFGVNFPAEIPLEHKILLLATALLIDLSLFENQEGFAD